MNVTVNITLKGGDVFTSDVEVDSLDEARVAKVDLTWNETVTAAAGAGAVSNVAAAPAQPIPIAS